MLGFKLNRVSKRAPGYQVLAWLDHQHAWVLSIEDLPQGKISSASTISMLRNYRCKHICMSSEIIHQEKSYNTIGLASHLCTCVLHRQLCYLHTLKLPQFFHFHGDFDQKWHFAHPEVSFAHPELPFLAKSVYNTHYRFRQYVLVPPIICPLDNIRCPLVLVWLKVTYFLLWGHENGSKPSYI